jgi:thiamine pyrophosphate-dependent acetolactate synthase large subunit-like protein
MKRPSERPPSRARAVTRHREIAAVPALHKATEGPSSEQVEAAVRRANAGERAERGDRAQRTNQVRRDSLPERGPLTVASAIVELLEPWVGAAFNVAGAGNVPFITAWSERDLPWFTALEEKRGLIMAEGYARATGRMALMTTTAGPGATNLATALLIALRERSPVFVVSGQTPAAHATRLPVQALDIKAFARELTLKTHELTAPEQVEGYMTELVRAALAGRQRGPVLLAVPADLWQRPCALRGSIQFTESWSAGIALRCATALMAATRPLIIAGSGVIQARASALLYELVEHLPQARVATTPRALGAFPASHPRSVQAIGFGGSVDRELDEADLVLVLGSRLHEMSTNFDERLYQKRIFHIDIDPDVPGSAFPAEGFCADLARALADLAANVSQSWTSHGAVAASG